jgi:hypothetical protein
LDFPTGIQWQYSSEKCLRGYDPSFPNEAIFDWYALSGGQLKYYPKARFAKFRSPIFMLSKPSDQLTISKKAELYFPDHWAKWKV